MNKGFSKKILTYTAIFEPDEGGGYVVQIPAIPGCVTEGDTLEEATAMVQDAIEGCLAVLRDEGQPIPREDTNVIVKKISVKNPSAIIHGSI